MAYARSSQHEVWKRKELWWDEAPEDDFTDEYPFDDEPEEDEPVEPQDETSRFHVAHRDHEAKTCATPAFRIHDVSPQELGHEGERIAASYLKMRGWEIVEQNWTSPYGEADIIAYDDDECVFIEVKTRLVRSEREEVYPELAVHAAKRKRYERMARYYMAQHQLDSVRFDVIAICIVAERMARVHHLVNAFGIES